MIGFCFSIVTPWTALSGVFIIGAESGGARVMIWSVTLAVAYSMAEMCSAYPVAGGQYSWCAVLARRKIARGFSYVCGWSMLVGILAMGAVNNFIVANFIVAVADLNNPEYAIETWYTVLVDYAVAALALAFNIFLPSLLERISCGLIIWNISAFVIVVVTILSVNNHKQSSAFVFTDFVNLAGFSKGYASIVGLLQAAFGMCCYDAPAHMTEEIKDARTMAPKAIIWSVYIGAVTGFVFLVAACFSIGDIGPTALSPTGVPIVQVFFDSTSSVAAASCLAVTIIVISLGASNALTAEGGRAVYAFAHANGLPFSDLWRKVEKKRQIPVYIL